MCMANELVESKLKGLAIILTVFVFGAVAMYILLEYSDATTPKQHSNTQSTTSADSSIQITEGKNKSTATSSPKILPDLDKLAAFNKRIATSSLPLPVDQSDLPTTILPGRVDHNDSFTKRSKVILLRVGVDTPYEKVRTAVDSINGGIVSFLPNTWYEDDNTSTPDGPSDVYQVIFPESLEHFEGTEQLERYRFVRDVNWDYPGVTKPEPVDDRHDEYLDTPYQFIVRGVGTTSEILKYSQNTNNLSKVTEKVGRFADDRSVYTPTYNRLAVMDKDNTLRTYNTNTNSLMFSGTAVSEIFSFSSILPSPDLDQIILSFEKFDEDERPGESLSHHRWFSFSKGDMIAGLRSQERVFATRWSLDDTYYFGSAVGKDCGFYPNTHRYDSGSNTLVKTPPADNAEETNYLIAPDGRLAVKLLPSSELREEGLVCEPPRDELRIVNKAGNAVMQRSAPDNAIYEPLGWTPDSRHFVLRRLSYRQATDDVLREENISQTDYLVFNINPRSVSEFQSKQGLIDALSLRRLKPQLFLRRIHEKLQLKENSNGDGYRLSLYHQTNLVDTDGKIIDSSSIVGSQSSHDYSRLQSIVPKYRDIIMPKELKE